MQQSAISIIGLKSSDIGEHRNLPCQLHVERLDLVRRTQPERRRRIAGLCQWIVRGQARDPEQIAMRDGASALPP
jgi:hypothetical protein